MPRIITTEPLTATAFAPFGDVLQTEGDFRLINAGLCKRYHDLARLDFGDAGVGTSAESGAEAGAGAGAGISIFSAATRSLPYTLDMIERHPQGSQAFLPLHQQPFLVIVAASPDSTPRAFLTNGAQGVNLLRGTWHGVLTPLHAPGLFAVVDRIGPGANLEEYAYPCAWEVHD